MGLLANGAPLVRVRDVRLPGRTTRFDYQALDVPRRRLYVAHLGDSTLDVLDLDTLGVEANTGTIATRIPLAGCDGAHGVSIDPAHHRAFVACERSGTVVTVDLEHQRVTGRNRVGTAPDVLAFDAVLGRLYVASESGTVTTFATRSAPITKVGEQRVAPSAHSVSVDPSTHRVFFPLEDVRGHPVLRVMRPKL